MTVGEIACKLRLLMVIVADMNLIRTGYLKNIPNDQVLWFYVQYSYKRNLIVDIGLVKCLR